MTLRKKHAVDAIPKIEYDIKMFIACITKIYSEETDEVTLNALKEAALLHYRNLYRFFMCRPEGDGDKNVYYFDLKNKSFEPGEYGQEEYMKICGKLEDVSRSRAGLDERDDGVYYELFLRLMDPIFGFLNDEEIDEHFANPALLNSGKRFSALISEIRTESAAGGKAV